MADIYIQHNTEFKMQTTQFVTCNTNFRRGSYSEELFSTHPALNILLKWEELHLCLTALLFVLMVETWDYPTRLSDIPIKLRMSASVSVPMYIQ